MSTGAEVPVIPAVISKLTPSTTKPSLSCIDAAKALLTTVSNMCDYLPAGIISSAAQLTGIAAKVAVANLFVFYAVMLG